MLNPKQLFQQGIQDCTSSDQQEQMDSPLAAPVVSKTTANHLPSSVIQKQLLSKPDDIILKYPKLRGESKAGSLAVKLAKEAIFGEEVMVKCTVSGCRELLSSSAGRT